MITEHGHPFTLLVPARGIVDMTEERAAAARRDLGLDGLTVQLPPEFNDLTFSRAVLGLTD